MSDLSKPEYIWFGDSVRPWHEAQVHVWTEVVLRAMSIFEGLRGYWDAEQSRHYFLHLGAHLQRLNQSARVVRLPKLVTYPELTYAIGKLTRQLDYREDIYLRPTLYLEEGRYTVHGKPDDCGFFMPAFPVPRDASIETGITCQVSSWRRSDDSTAPPQVKAAANYYNLRLARMEAISNGHGEAILLNTAGKVAETGGASVFLVRDGRIATPHLSSSILDSITRRSALTLLSEHGIHADERSVDRTELYTADEVFLTGTLCEITPVVAVDGVTVGSGRPGPITRDLQQRYYKACSAGPADTRGWLTAGPVLA